MKATILSQESIESANGNVYQKIQLKEHPARKCITFAKEKLEVGKEYEFIVKENPDTSFVLTPKKPFASFNRGQAADTKLEILKLAVSLVNESKVEIKHLEATTKRLKEIYDKL